MPEEYGAAEFLRGMGRRFTEQTGEIGRRRPLEKYQSGELSMKQALDRPGLWVAAPGSPGEYKGLETLWQRGAERAGVRPAEAQALGWYGSGDITALKSAPENYIENIERMARVAALRRGVTPEQAMRDFVLGREHLGRIDPRLAAGMAAGGGAAAAAPYLMKKEQ